jgi:hypothetical protein
MLVKIGHELCPCCGGLVAFHEDSIILRAIAFSNPDLISKGSRHIQCDPSIAQYVCHPSFPAVYDYRYKYDKRRGNPYLVSIREEILTEAWVNLQLSCGMSINFYERGVYD